MLPNNNHFAHLSQDGLQQSVDWLKHQMFCRDMTDNQYHISGRYDDDKRLLWQLKNEQERRELED